MNSNPGIIGIKLGNMQFFTDDGNVTRVTVVEAGPVTVIGKRTKEKDGYSALILGMGETIDEVHVALADLHTAGCDLITITQYLRPSPRHHPVERWVRPEEFVALADVATGIGFAGVMSGPLVRSSYRAGRLYRQARGE